MISRYLRDEIDAGKMETDIGSLVFMGLDGDPAPANIGGYSRVPREIIAARKLERMRRGMESYERHERKG